jgi:hypothetical protein
LPSGATRAGCGSFYNLYNSTFVFLYDAGEEDSMAQDALKRKAVSDPGLPRLKMEST